MPHKLFKGFPDERTLTRRTSSVSCSSGLCLVCGPHRLYPRPLQERLHTVLMAALTVELFLLLSKYLGTSPNSPKLPQHFPTPPVARAPNMDWNSPAVLSLVLEGPHFPAHFLSRHSLQGPVDCLSLSQPASHSVESSSARQHASKRESKSSPVVRWLVRSSFVH